MGDPHVPDRRNALLMGANEKVDATTHGEYTPTTEDVRNGYVHDSEAEYYDPEGYPSSVAEAKRAFDRWLAAHVADALEAVTAELRSEVATSNRLRTSWREDVAEAEAERDRFRAERDNLAAVIEKVEEVASRYPYTGLRYALTNTNDGPLASAPGDVLREHDRATAERAWNELYATQFDGAPFEMSDTTGITDPNNPYRIEGGI